VDFALNPTNGVDLVLFTGDAFKTRDPTPTQQREFAPRIRRLARNTPVFLLAGNHDLPSAIGRAHTMEIYPTLEVENVIVAQKPGVYRIETHSGPIQIVALPWIVYSHLLAREEYRDRDPEKINSLIVARLEELFTRPDGLLARLDSRVPAVLAVHGTVQGAVYGSERSVMLGQDVILPRSLIAHPAFDYVALGHIHKYQDLNPGNQPPVVYCGSLERIDFGEEKEEKGFVVAQISRGEGSCSYAFHPIQARRLVTIRVTATGDDPTAQVLEAISRENIEDAVVRVLISTTAEAEPRLKEEQIWQALAPAFYVAAVARDVERPKRIRLGNSTAVEELTPRQLLERYLEAKGIPAERIAVLLQYADEIMPGATEV